MKKGLGGTTGNPSVENVEIRQLSWFHLQFFRRQIGSINCKFPADGLGVLTWCCSGSMPSEIDVAKRELVKVLRELAAKYRVNLVLTRESSTNDVEKAFRKVSGKAHPDKGGLLADFQKLSASNDARKPCGKASEKKIMYAAQFEV